MQQTKLESLLETILNTLTGYLISYLAWVFVVGPSLGMTGGAKQAFWVTNFFTILSIARSYLWRRFFNAGVHKVIHRFVSHD